MGRWAYYSPLFVGIMLVVLVNDALRTALPTLAAGWQWLIVAGAALAVGIQCQVLMVGVQGAFAQVLPVPRGRSIRGPGAVIGGWLLVLWVGLAGAAALLQYGGVGPAALVVGVAALAALLAAGLVYVWSLPAAMADFGSERNG
jgi:hypothetical protein